MHPPMRFGPSCPRAVSSARVASSAAISRRPSPSSIVASPIAAHERISQYVLENHFDKFSDLLSVTHQHFKKEDFPKGIPASAHHERRFRFSLTIFRCLIE